ncbi:PAS domain S-box protein [Rhodocytophaga rosea]|uniref:histidine kinase n=1 Tax=Rhodocytophaga rosea TaxID=2704465 RepID=A0A6C0GM76_9BACT|nr:PAS domain S-box protein [Rhodocytophaga rosea]QHT68740.1 PAS domain S-box protein [Rhodocytophaga rosea]
MENNLKLSRRIKLTFFAAILSIALVMIGLQYIVERKISKQVFDSQVINISGRQRMYSQKITKTILLLSQAKDSTTYYTYLRTLQQDVKTWHAAHKALLYRSKLPAGEIVFIPGENTDAAQQLVEQHRIHHLNMLKAVSVIVNTTYPIIDYSHRAAFDQALSMVLAEEPFVLKAREEITRQYLAESAQKIEGLARTVKVITLILLLVLLLEGLLIFRPLEMLIKNFVDQLNNKISQLHAHHEEMYAIQEELAQANAFQSALLSNAVVSIISTNKQGIITSINPVVSKWLGYQPDELLNQHTPDILHKTGELSQYANKISAELGIPFTSGLEAMLSKASHGLMQQEEFTYVHKDGTECTVLLNISGIFNSIGAMDGLVCVGVDITAKKKVEEQLRESEQLYKLISENSLDLIRLHNPDGSYVYASPSVIHLLGYQPDELLHLSPKDVIHPADYQHAMEYTTNILQTKKPINHTEYKVRRKDGRFIWLETFTKPILNENGDVTLLLTSSRDITARKQVQEALEVSELKLKAAQKIAHIGNWEYDPHSMQSIWSDEMFLIHGLDISGKVPSAERYLPMVHADDLTQVVESMDLSIRDGKEFINDSRIILPDGEVRWVNVIGKVQKDVSGNVIKVYGTTMDITERKARETQLNEVSAFLNSVLDSSLSGVMAFRSVRNSQHTIVDFEWLSVNKQAEQLTGRTATHLVGKKMLEELPGNRIDGLFDKYVQVVETGHSLNLEHFYEHEGIRVWFHIVAVKLQDGLAVTFSDITDSKVIELEREILNKQLNLQKFALDAAAIVAITDKKGIITYANERFCKISGYTKDELIGNTHQLVNAGYHEPGFFKDMWIQISAGCMWRGEICNKSKDGSRYWVDTVIVPFLDEQERPYQYMAIRFDITSRKEAENNLSFALARLSAIMENMQAAIVVEDENGKTALINHQFCQMFSIPLTPDEITGMDSILKAESYRKAFADEAGFMKRMATMLKNHLPVNGEELPLKDKRVLERDYVPIYIDKIYRGHLWMYKDITERKKWEDKLIESSRFINALIDHSPLPIQIYDRHGFSMQMNEAQRTLLGIPENTYGVGYFNVLTDPFQKLNGSNLHFERAYRGETVILSDQQMDLTNTSNQWNTKKRILFYDQIIFPIKDQTGSVEAVVSFVQDVTYKMVARVELEETKRFLESIMNAIPNYLYIFDIDTNTLVYANLELVQMLGYSENELQQMGSEIIPTLIHPDDMVLIESYFQNFKAAGNGHTHTEFRVRNHHQQYRLLQSRDVPFKRNNKGDVCQVIGIVQDITDLREAELELKEAYHELQMSEEQLRQRGEELRAMNEVMENTIVELKTTQSHLVQSEKMASLGQLTAGIAHEINNPVNFIYVGISNLKNSLDEIFDLLKHYDALATFQSMEEIQAGLAYIQELKEELYYKENLQVISETLKSVESGASRTAEIVKGLRNFSRLDEAAIKHAFVHEGLDNTLILLTNQYKDHIKIFKEYDSLIPSIECYPGQLNQVFMNILTNAIQAIEGNGEIYITTSNLPEHISISIRDSGKGMPENVREKIFEPFFTTKPVGQGTGLGLSITYGIIQKHKGEIRVESEPGKGTTFILILPKVLSEEKMPQVIISTE